MSDAFDPLRAALDGWAAAGRQARFWLRDDDAVDPGAALDRLLALGAAHRVPVTLAVIPQHTGSALADRLQGRAVEVAVHGWSHADHAAPGRKSCELGPERSAPVVLHDLAQGLAQLTGLHGARAVPVLVPPWNRIDPGVIAGLRGLGFRGLSVFGPEPAGQPLPRINAHVDLIDWHGTRGGRDPAALVAGLVARLAVAETTGGHVGFMTHHLVHDSAAWAFIDRLLEITTAHPGCRWHSLSDLLAAAGQSSVT